MIVNKRTLALLITLMLLIIEVFGQRDSSFAVRVRLASIDTSQREVCYDAQISNWGPDTIILSSYNIWIFYDAAIARYTRDSTLTPQYLNGTSTRDFGATSPGDISGSGLAYEDSIGTIRLGLTSKQEGEGVQLAPDSTWYGTSRICFEIHSPDMTAPEICLPINFYNDQIAMANVVHSPDLLRVWESQSLTREIVRDTTTSFDLVPMGRRSACFVINEAQHMLCADGIDNDEDGAADCDDCDCSPGVTEHRSIPPSCTEQEGRVFFHGGDEGVMYSIDGGQTFYQDTVYSLMDAGTYELIARKNGVTHCQYSATLVIDPIDCREADALTCADGIDNDMDGLIDRMDEDCCPEAILVASTNPRTCPRLDDGEIEIMVQGPDLVYSIDSGITYHTEALFASLSVDTFFILVQDSVTHCILSYDQNPVILTSDQLCPEVCDDGLDNDRDGALDCEDTDCLSAAICRSAPVVMTSNIIDIHSVHNAKMMITANQPLTISVTIYDRWGSPVYSDDQFETDSGSGWNGMIHHTTSGQSHNYATSGVYIYHLHFTVDGNIYDLWGDITVIN